MKTIKTLNAASFSINGLPYQKGSARIEQFGERVSLIEYAHDSRNYIDRVHFSEFRDQADQPFANVEDLLTYLGQTILI